MTHVVEDYTKAYTDIEDISERFATARYDDLEVLVDKTNGYANASRLCTDARPKARRVDKWFETDLAKEVLRELGAILEVSPTSLLVKVRDPSDAKGIYVHPSVLPHIAAWAIPPFAIKLMRTQETLRRERLRAINAEDKGRRLEAQLEQVKTTNMQMQAQLHVVKAELDVAVERSRAQTLVVRAFVEEVDKHLRTLSEDAVDSPPSPPSRGA